MSNPCLPSSQQEHEHLALSLFNEFKLNVQSFLDCKHVSSTSIGRKKESILDCAAMPRNDPLHELLRQSLRLFVKWFIGHFNGCNVWSITVIHLYLINVWPQITCVLLDLTQKPTEEQVLSRHSLLYANIIRTQYSSVLWLESLNCFYILHILRTVLR